MTQNYLEITYRGGKPFAAYLYLRRQPGDLAARTQRCGELLVDYSEDGRPIGIELTRFEEIDLTAINQILKSAHEEEVTARDLFPLHAA